MEYALYKMMLSCMYMEVSEMSIMIKIFLMAYLVIVVLMTVLGVIWAMSLIFAPDWVKRKSLIKH